MLSAPHPITEPVNGYDPQALKNMNKFARIEKRREQFGITRSCCSWRTVPCPATQGISPLGDPGWRGPARHRTRQARMLWQAGL